VTQGWPPALNSAAAMNLYRLIEEALNNVRMHSGALTVQVLFDEISDTELAVMVRDDGRGVDTDPARVVGLGTIGMRERAVFLGGKLRIDSEVGHGTVVHAVFPKHLLAAEARPLTDTTILARRNNA
jgi:signal transduction histidine kinase